MLTTLDSIAVTSGKSLERSVNACLASILAHNYYELLGIHLSIYASEMISTSSAAQSIRNPTGTYQYSPIPTSLRPCGRTMNIGKCGRFTRLTSSLTEPFSAINYFSSPRPIIKVDREGNEETWVEKTYYTTEESFPAVLRRSEVVAVEIVELSPVENALLEVEQKNKELNALNMKYSTLAKTAQVVSTNPLSMALNGVVDAPAGGGIASYRSLFLTHNYIARHPERKEFVEKLRAAVDEQVRVLCCLSTD